MSVDKIHELEARIRALEEAVRIWTATKVADVEEKTSSLFGKKG